MGELPQTSQNEVKVIDESSMMIVSYLELERAKQSNNRVFVFLIINLNSSKALRKASTDYYSSEKLTREPQISSRKIGFG